MSETNREMAFRLARWDRNHKTQLIAQRRKRGMTQKDLAELMGTTPRWVRKFERYDSDPRVSEVRRYTVAVYWEGESDASTHNE